MWYGCLSNVALCDIGVSVVWHCVVWDTLLVSILGPAWRQSRTLGGVASQRILIGKMRKRSLVAINIYQVVLVTVVEFQIFEGKEMILLSPFCKSVRAVCTPISHFPK